MIDLARFEQHIRERGLNVLNVRVLQNGELIGKVDFVEDIRRLQHSVSKSFTCMAVGLAIEARKLTLDTALKDVFPDYIGANGDTHATTNVSINGQNHAMKPEDISLFNLLRMSTGHDNPPFWADERLALKDKDWVEHYLSLPLDRPPGEKFTYSSGDTFIISAMIQASVGQTVKDYLVPRLFAPLGIVNVDWETTARGITLGCAGLQINTEELSRFGQLLLQKGVWQGQQLIPEAWIDYATQKQIESDGDSHGDWGQGYGFQFWRCTHDAYRADGAHGQFCIVLPDEQAVIAINSMEDHTKEILDTVWEDIWPLL